MSAAPANDQSATDAERMLRMEEELKELRGLLEKALALLASTRAELELARAEIKRKDQIIEGLRQRLFGASSEKLDPAQLQLMFDEVVLGKPAPSPDQSDGRTSAPEGEKSSAAKTRRTKADRFPKNLKVIIEKVMVADEVLANPGLYEKISEEHHDELDVTKAQMIWRRTVREKHVLRNDRSRPPVIAPAPLPSIPGTLIAPAFAAQLVVDKFEDHQPHYRQQKTLLRRFGVDVGRQTLNSWTHATIGHLRPLGPAIKAEVFQATELQVDETPVGYLKPGHGSTGTGYLWIYNNVQGKACYYDWRTGRGLDHLLDGLGYDGETGTITFEGTIQCDGYSVYQALAARFAGIRLAGCLAHIRRKFVEAMDQAPDVTLPVLLLIQRIYQIERQIRMTQAPAACRGLIRRTRSRPLADEIRRLIVDARTSQLPRGALGEAITYAINQWDKFLVCLEDGRLEIDNNLVYAASGINQIMPPPYLCRAHKREARIAAGGHLITYPDAA